MAVLTTGRDHLVRIAEKSVGVVTLETILGRVTSNSDRRVPSRYEEGVDWAGKMEIVTIAINNVWGGYAKDGASVDSYEKIGYHTGSVDFILGIIAGGCPVYAYCDDGNGCELGWRLVTL